MWIHDCFDNDDVLAGEGGVGEPTANKLANERKRSVLVGTKSTTGLVMMMMRTVMMMMMMMMMLGIGL